MGSRASSDHTAITAIIAPNPIITATPTGDEFNAAPSPTVSSPRASAARPSQRAMALGPTSLVAFSLISSRLGGLPVSQPMLPRINANDPATQHVPAAPGSAVKSAG